MSEGHAEMDARVMNGWAEERARVRELEARIHTLTQQMEKAGWLLRQILEAWEAAGAGHTELADDIRDTLNALEGEER